MLKTRTFPKGGIHPHGRKALANRSAIEILETPETVTVPMSQHLGAPAALCVKKGDQVARGQKIGSGTSFISADIHAPIGGTVSDIVKVMLPNSIESDAVVITAFSGDDPSAGQQASFTTSESALDDHSPEELLAMVKEAGIVGMGGATFPAHVKFNIPRGKHAEYLVINGVECEPYLTADHRIMLERADQILRGIAVIEKIISPDRVIIGIERNKMDAVTVLEQAITEGGYGYQVQPLKVKYPQGDEKQLLKAVMGREVPSGGLPIEIGAVVSNVGTAYAIFEAVFLKKPLMERCVTVTGKAIASPGNFQVSIGTSMRTLIERAGGFTEPPAKLVAGGPMMGFAFFDLDTPVTKGTSGILALTKADLDYADENPCISCGKCVAACPMGLQPTKLYKLIDHASYSEAMSLNLMDCKECGCCAYSCPSKIPLVHGFKFGKKMARKK